VNIDEFEHTFKIWLEFESNLSFQVKVSFDLQNEYSIEKMISYFHK
jgi:hypothetical protein